MGRKPLFEDKAVLGVLEEWLARHGMPPTIEELRLVLGVGSTRTALRYLERLEANGDIERWPGARGIRLLRSAAGGVQTVQVPLVGEAPAGPAVIAHENVESWLRLPVTVARKGHLWFVLRVRGDSMNQASVGGNLIDDGDLILVQSQGTADSGDIVVALIDGEATIKRLVVGPGYCVLRPESANREHSPILIETEFRIQGVVTRVFKDGLSHLA